MVETSVLKVRFQPGETRVVLLFRYILIIAFSLLITGKSGAQQYFRISGEMTIKSKNPSGVQAITIGEVFFDRNIRRIVYSISFPEPEIWVTTDSLTYIISKDSIISTQVSIGMSEFSVFNLALRNHLSNFGLEKSSYHIESVERTGENVITTWAPQESMEDKMGMIKVATLDKRLFGVVFLNHDGDVLRKQFFEDYMDISGLAFPGKIVEIGYHSQGESYQISSFRNIKIDELENNNFYNYALPDGRGKLPGTD